MSSKICRKCGYEHESPDFCECCGALTIESLINLVYPWQLFWMPNAHEGGLSCLYLQHIDFYNAALVIGDYRDSRMSQAWEAAAEAVIKHKPSIDGAMLSKLKDPRRDRLLADCLRPCSTESVLSRLIKLRKHRP